MPITPRLWTPIANALEAYRRRLAIEPSAQYEHIWRLIHIQEAVAVTLASLIASRVAFLSPKSASALPLRDLKSALTGVRSTNAGLERGDEDIEPSPWGGSIGAWVELLRRFGKESLYSGDEYLDALAAWLTDTPLRPLAFADAWAKVAPVPSNFRDPNLDRLNRVAAINSFRNKLAHVPVPQRLLADIHRGLRIEILDSLSSQCDASKHTDSLGFVATSYRLPLTGILLCGGTYVTGAANVGVIEHDSNRSSNTAVRARFPRDQEDMEWPVGPFFRIDGEAKVALLFRVNELGRTPGAAGYSREYHRFAAELEPVQYVTLAQEDIGCWLPDAQVSAADKVTSVSGESLYIEAASGAAETAQVAALDELRNRAEEAFSQRR